MNREAITLLAIVGIALYVFIMHQVAAVRAGRLTLWQYAEARHAAAPVCLLLVYGTALAAVTNMLVNGGVL